MVIYSLKKQKIYIKFKINFMKNSLVFFGTHEFAKAMLTALIETNEYEIRGVITQPDTIDRKKNIIESLVKKLALEHSLPLFQFETLKNIDTIAFPKADIFIVCEYGLIIPKTILDIPKLGTLNVHPSLLPYYRGASPIQTALMNGEKISGVTIMLMDEKMDHGPIVLQEKISIEKTDTFLTLRKKMIPLASKLLLEALHSLINKTTIPEEQNHDKATFCKLLTKDDGKINFSSQSAQEIYNLYRGLTPWPGIWTIAQNKRFKLLEIEPVQKNITPAHIKIENNAVYIGAKEGAIEIVQIQPEGKNSMGTKAFINGYRSLDGSSVI